MRIDLSVLWPDVVDAVRRLVIDIRRLLAVGVLRPLLVKEGQRISEGRTRRGNWRKDLDGGQNPVEEGNSML